jgi:hypothetical protein
MARESAVVSSSTRGVSEESGKRGMSESWNTEYLVSCGWTLSELVIDTLFDQFKFKFVYKKVWMRGKPALWDVTRIMYWYGMDSPSSNGPLYGYVSSYFFTQSRSTYVYIFIYEDVYLSFIMYFIMHLIITLFLLIDLFIYSLSQLFNYVFI